MTKVLESSASVLGAEDRRKAIGALLVLTQHGDSEVRRIVEVATLNSLDHVDFDPKPKPDETSTVVVTVVT